MLILTACVDLDCCGVDLDCCGVSLLVQFFDGDDFGGAVAIADYCPFQQVCYVSQYYFVLSCWLYLTVCDTPHRCSNLRVVGALSALSLATLLLATLLQRPTAQPPAALSRPRCGVALAEAFLPLLPAGGVAAMRYLGV